MDPSWPSSTEGMLAWEDLGPWQRAAVAAVRAGTTVAALAEPDRQDLRTDADRDHAEWIWLWLRSRLPQQDPLRVLAAHDVLREPPRPGVRRTHPCPLCGLPAFDGAQSEREVCPDCRRRAVDSAGRSVRGFNVDGSGGFVAYHVGPDGDLMDTCDEVTATGRVWIDGHACDMGEARFGGVTVEPCDSPQRGPGRRPNPRSRRSRSPTSTDDGVRA